MTCQINIRNWKRHSTHDMLCMISSGGQKEKGKATIHLEVGFCASSPGRSRSPVEQSSYSSFVTTTLACAFLILMTYCSATGAVTAHPSTKNRFLHKTHTFSTNNEDALLQEGLELPQASRVAWCAVLCLASHTFQAKSTYTTQANPSEYQVGNAGVPITACISGVRF